MITKKFPFAGEVEQTFTVPEGASLLGLRLLGAQGGNFQGLPVGGGAGGQTEATLQVAANDTLKIIVGAQGKSRDVTTGGEGGFGYGSGGNGGSGNSGGRGSAGGGGGTAIIYKGQLLVAGGGGGSTESGKYGASIGGAAGGGEQGMAGSGGGDNLLIGGRGGGQFTAGVGGQTNGNGIDGQDGQGTKGGDGVTVPSFYSGAGSAGGGGGYRGGGGGAIEIIQDATSVSDCGTGGGGSGYIGGDMTELSYRFKDATTMANVNDKGNGSAEIRYEISLTGIFTISVSSPVITFHDSTYVTITFHPGLGAYGGAIYCTVYGPFDDYDSISCDEQSPKAFYEALAAFIDFKSTTSSSFTPVRAGFYSWQVSLRDDTDFLRTIYTSTCGDGQGSQQIFRVDPLFTAESSATEAKLGAQVFVTLTIEGIPTINTVVDYKLYGPFETEDLIQCDSSQQEEYHNSKNVTQNVSESDPYTITKPGFYGWKATFSYYGVDYSTECSIFQVDAKITTQQSSSHLDLGSSIHVKATTHNIELYQDAMMDFTLYGPFGNPQWVRCNLDQAPIAFQESQHVTGITTQSSNFTPIAAGFYIWQATFRQTGIVLASECAVQEGTIRIDPIITAQVTSSEIYLGSATSVVSQLRGMAQFGTAATVAFFLYGPFETEEKINCFVGNPVKVVAIVYPGEIVGDISTTSSPEYVPEQVGYYTWVVSFVQNILSATTVCGDYKDTRQIFRVVPDLTAQVSSQQINLGSSISITATINGLNESERMLFTLYGPFAEKSMIRCPLADDDDEKLIVYSSWKDATAPDYQAQDSFIPTASGFYTWQVSIGEWTTSCGDDPEANIFQTFHVGPLLLVLVDEEQVTAGTPNFVNVNMEGAWNLEPEDQLRFYMYGPFSDPECTDKDPSVRRLVGTMQDITAFPVQSMPFIPDAAGHYFWRVEFTSHDGFSTITPCGNHDGNIQSFVSTPSAIAIASDKTETSINLPISAVTYVGGITDFTGATVLFSVYGPFSSKEDITCQTEKVIHLEPVTNMTEQEIPSPPFVPEAAGFYTWHTRFVQNQIEMETDCQDELQHFIVEPGILTLSIDPPLILVGSETHAIPSYQGTELSGATIQFSVVGPVTMVSEVIYMPPLPSISPSFVPTAAGSYEWHAVLKQNGLETEANSIPFTVAPVSFTTYVIGSDWLAGKSLVIQATAEGITHLSGIEFTFIIHGPFQTEEEAIQERALKTKTVLEKNPASISFTPRAAGYYTWSVSFRQNDYHQAIPDVLPIIFPVGIESLQARVSYTTVSVGSSSVSIIGTVNGIRDFENAAMEFRLYPLDDCGDDSKLIQNPEVITQISHKTTISPPCPATLPEGFYIWKVLFRQNGMAIETLCITREEQEQELIFQVVGFSISNQVMVEKEVCVTAVANISDLPASTSDATVTFYLYGPFQNKRHVTCQGIPLAQSDPITVTGSVSANFCPMERGYYIIEAVLFTEDTILPTRCDKNQIFYIDPVINVEFQVLSVTTSTVGTPVIATAIVGTNSNSPKQVVVIFSVYSNNTLLWSSQVVGEQGTVVVSPPFVPSLTGPYFWRVMLKYSDKFLDKFFSVTKATPSLTFTCDEWDRSCDRNVLLSSGYNPTGKLVWIRRSLASKEVGLERQVNGNGIYSNPFFPDQVGSVLCCKWECSYSGDDRNLPATVATVFLSICL